MYLLDTCVLSEVVRPSPDENVIRWMAAFPDFMRLHLSSITIGELQKGISKLGRTAKAKRLQHWLDEDAQDWFAGRIVPFDGACARIWGEKTAECDKKGCSRPTLDAMIAATAIAKNFTLVTRNVSDMEGMGVAVLNPWQRHEWNF